MTKTQPSAAHKESHACINGRVLEYEAPPDDVAAFLDRVRVAASSPQVGENDMIALVYGRENPLLDQTMLPGSSMVTRDVIENPVYRVMLDLLDRKRVKLGIIDPEKVATRYTMTPQEAAEVVGVSRNAIMTAIDAGKLPVWMKEGRYMLDPKTLHAYQPEKRGTPPRLRIRFGSAPGMSLRIKAPMELVEVAKALGVPKDSKVKEGWLMKWERMAVMTGSDSENYRFFVLEPGGPQNRLTHGPFAVEGRFKIVEKVNQADRAHEAWKKFEPA